MNNNSNNLRVEGKPIRGGLHQVTAAFLGSRRAALLRPRSGLAWGEESRPAEAARRGQVRGASGEFPCKCGIL